MSDSPNFSRMKVLTVLTRYPGWVRAEVLHEGSVTTDLLVGDLPDEVMPGDIIEAYGREDTHPRYGPQWKLDMVLVHLSGNTDVIASWLQATMPNIGPVRASEIAKGHGAQIWWVLENEPEQLLKVNGITNDRLGLIMKAYEEEKAGRYEVQLLMNDGLPFKFAHMAFKKWRFTARAEIARDPYCLYYAGMPFSDVDDVAVQKLGMEKTDKRRIGACTLLLLNETARNGDCYMLEHELRTGLQQKLKLKQFDMDKAYHRAVGYTSGRKELFLSHRLDDAEHYTAHRIDQLMARPLSSKWKPDHLEDLGDGIAPDESQKAAIELMANAPLCVVTGGPGTGKTTCLKRLVRHLEHTFRTCILLAPTGKAARRMSEATGCKARTIHRALAEAQVKKHGQFSGNILDYDIRFDIDMIIVDEASMIDIELMAALLVAVDPARTRIVFVGDHDQLPPVGPGSPFKDMIESGKVPVRVLTTLHRQAAQSWICNNAPRVINGEALDLDEDVPDFIMYELESDRACDIPDAIEHAMQEQGLSYDNTQVLAPQKKNYGVISCNKHLQGVFNPRSKRKRTKKEEWQVYNGKEGTYDIYVGDRVIQTKNDYELGLATTEATRTDTVLKRGVMNGEIGTVVAQTTKHMDVEYEGDRVRYFRGQEKNLNLAYVLTVHKSQGSEWPVVVLVCHSAHSFMLSRKLLYTAITRGKKKMVLIGDRQGVHRAVSNIRDEHRRTLLTTRLRHEQLIEHEFNHSDVPLQLQANAY